MVTAYIKSTFRMEYENVRKHESYRTIGRSNSLRVAVAKS